MSTIKIAEFTDPSDDFDFELKGKKYHLLPHDDMMDLMTYIETKRIALMDKYKSLIKTANYLSGEKNVDKAVTNFVKHKDDIVKERKALDVDLKQLFIDFFDTALLDEDGQADDAGKILSKTVVTSTALGAWYDRITALVKQQDDKINDNVSHLTDGAFQAAGAVLGDQDEDTKVAK